MKKKLLLFLLFIPFWGFSQTVSLAGSKDVNSGSEVEYTVSLTGYSASTSFQIECSEHGQLVSFNNATRGSVYLNNNSGYKIKVKWKDVEASNAYVKIYETYNTQKIGEVSPIKISRSAAIQWEVEAPATIYQYHTFDVKLRINGNANSNYTYTNQSPNFVITSGETSANQRGYFKTSGNQTLTYLFKKGDIKKTVSTNIQVIPSGPPVSGISGPSTLGAGSSVILKPVFRVISTSSSFSYQWDVTPRTGVSFYGQNNTAFEVQFNQMGEYIISCRLTDTNNGLFSTVTKQITIDAGMVIIQSLSSSNNFDFKFDNSNDRINEIVPYQVYNQGTGEMVKNGNLNIIEGGNIDLSKCQKGIYIVRFDFGNNINKTQKIIVK